MLVSVVAYEQSKAFKQFVDRFVIWMGFLVSIMHVLLQHYFDLPQLGSVAISVAIGFLISRKTLTWWLSRHLPPLSPPDLATQDSL